MGLPNPKTRKPTASEVVDWALYMAKNRRVIDVDRAYGGQCWDVPNYILERYWGSELGATQMLWLKIQLSR